MKSDYPSDSGPRHDQHLADVPCSESASPFVLVSISHNASASVGLQIVPAGTSTSHLDQTVGTVASATVDELVAMAFPEINIWQHWGINE